MSLEADLRRGVKAARDLSIETDNLTELLEHLERAIWELGLGVSARVVLSEEEWLSFTREGRIWRFVVEREGTTQPLINAKRLTRIQAVDKIPELLKALVDKACEETKAVQAAGERAASFLEALRAFIQQHGKT